MWWVVFFFFFVWIYRRFFQIKPHDIRGAKKFHSDEVSLVCNATTVSSFKNLMSTSKRTAAESNGPSEDRWGFESRFIYCSRSTRAVNVADWICRRTWGKRSQKHTTTQGIWSHAEMWSFVVSADRGLVQVDSFSNTFITCMHQQTLSTLYAHQAKGWSSANHAD